jgi:hypothetical protein
MKAVKAEKRTDVSCQGGYYTSDWNEKESLMASIPTQHGDEGACRILCRPCDEHLVA